MKEWTVTLLHIKDTNRCTNILWWFHYHWYDIVQLSNDSSLNDYPKSSFNEALYKCHYLIVRHFNKYLEFVIKKSQPKAEERDTTITTMQQESWKQQLDTSNICLRLRYKEL